MRPIYANQTDKGKLIVQASTNERGRPVAGANVRVYQKDAQGDEKLIEQAVTDNSGLCPEFELNAPPLDYSLTPGSPMPYAQYNVEIEADGFETLVINDIQVLPDVVAIQNSMMFGLSGFRTQQAAQEVITIGHHTLYYEYPEKIPESAVKSLPPPTGFVVLDRVVVPETIVVHAGHPDKPAPKHYVPFRDYIKNVASSEIYATWPKSAITSNVLAILSFTLNRVFTEWYRNKGKDFTITSSTDLVSKW